MKNSGGESASSWNRDHCASPQKHWLPQRWSGTVSLRLYSHSNSLFSPSLHYDATVHLTSDLLNIKCHNTISHRVAAAWVGLSTCSSQQGLERGWLKESVHGESKKSRYLFHHLLKVFWWGIRSAAFCCSLLLWRVHDDECETQRKKNKTERQTRPLEMWPELIACF